MKQVETQYPMSERYQVNEEQRTVTIGIKTTPDHNNCS